jgi:hypothetical protein
MSPEPDLSMAQRESNHLREIIEKARALHVSCKNGTWCDQCDQIWPCDTVRVLDGGKARR